MAAGLETHGYFAQDLGLWSATWHLCALSPAAPIWMHTCSQVQDQALSHEYQPSRIGAGYLSGYVDYLCTGERSKNHVSHMYLFIKTQKEQI